MRNLKKKKELYAAFMDLKKVYEELCTVLYEYDVEGKRRIYMMDVGRMRG